MEKLQIENIPEDLTKFPHWVAWKSEDRGNGKISKRPVNPMTGKYAKTNDSATWGKYETAVAHCQDNGLQGIGYVFSKDDPFIGIDLDDCLNPEGTFEAWAEEIVKQFDSYTEISPSGRGAHIFLRGRLPGAGKNNGQAEMYDTGRFFTMTGNHMQGTPTEIADRDEKATAFYQDFSNIQQRQPRKTLLDKKDEALIQQKMDTPNGQKFEELWSGNHSGYPSQSEADLALCKVLAGWTDNNPDRVDHLFRCSGLFRPKWDEQHYSDGKTYGQATVQKAVESTTSASMPATETQSGKSGLFFKLTDLGNAERLASRSGDDIRYCHAWKCWLIWDGTRWGPDKTEQINQKAKTVVRSIYQEASLADDSSIRQAIARHAERSESDARIKAMVSRARSESGIPVLPEELDQNPWLLNCLNGTLNLKTGKLMPHNRYNLITQIAPVKYDPDATCPAWDAFLGRIMADNDNLVSFLQRAIGYSLTGDTSEQSIFIFYGTGANGKTTFMQTAGSMLADYAMQTPTETLLIKRKGSIPNDVARLRGARLVTASEAEADEHLAESLIKQMTGQDTISARFLHQEWFDFEPTHKIFLATNHKPVIKGTDHAIWRRIKLIPFEVTIPESEQDRHLLVKLREELSGILSWAVRGCLEWLKNGLGEPDEVKTATRNYRTEMDTFAQFIDDRCIIDPSAKATSKLIHEAYTEWSEINGERKLGIQALGRKLVDQGFKPIQVGKSRARGYAGIGLLGG